MARGPSLGVPFPPPPMKGPDRPVVWELGDSGSSFRPKRLRVPVGAFSLTHFCTNELNSNAPYDSQFCDRGPWACHSAEGFRIDHK